MNNDQKLVSVVIPTYKRESSILKRAVQSVIKQNYEYIEIIVIDDNEFNDKYHKNNEKMFSLIEYDKITYYKNPQNMGGALSRNKGIELSKGDYITFLDDDDIYLENKISYQVNYMEKYNTDLCFTNLRVHNEKNKLIDYRDFTWIKEFDNKSFLKHHLMYHLTGTPTFMFKKFSIINIGMFENTTMGQEYYLMMKAIEQDLKIGFLNRDDVVAFRHKEGGISFGVNKIIGEKELFKFKKQYFSNLSFSERAFVRFRHNAVLSIAYKRNKNYIKFALVAIYAIFCSPLGFIKEIIRLLKNINTVKGESNYESISRHTQ